MSAGITRAMIDDAESDGFPVLDVGGYIAGDPHARETLAAELAHALERVGFLVVVNHGVPQPMIDAIFFLLEHPFSAIPLVSLLPALALYLALGLSPLQLLYTWLAGELFFFLFFFVSFVSFLYVEVPLRFPPPPKRLRRSLAG